MIKNPEISVVIPAYNEEKNILLTLQALVNQKTGYIFEVILVDNNSTDRTSHFAKKFADKLNLRIVFEKTKGRGSARARGFNEASGKVILSLDADTIVSENWVQVLASNLTDEYVAITTPCKIEDFSPFKNSIFNFLQPKAMFFYSIIFGHYWLSGFSFAIKRNIYEKSGGFNKNLQTQEDLDLSFRVYKLGKIKYIPHPVIFSGRRFKQNWLKGVFEYVQTFLQTFLFKSENAYLNNPR